MVLRKFTAVTLAAVATSFVSLSALAAPVTYNYSTLHGGLLQASSNAAVLTALGGPAVTVSGSFIYDAETPFTTYTQNIGYEAGRAVYSGAVSQLSGTVNSTVGGLSFIDNGTGVATVGNEVPSLGRDSFSLNADPTPRLGENTTPAEYAHQLAGFNVGDYTLHNVRLYWVEGYFAAPDFLSNDDLMPTPPTFYGVVALDFILTADPTNTANSPYYSRTVYFGGLTASVAAVPEPGTTALALAGLAGVALAIRRHRRQAPQA